MYTNELNDYIKRYIETDNTKSAIMLTGEWGTGKSHYIRNELIPYLKNGEDNCVVVSLYGVKNLSDISRSIYLEIRAKNMNKKSEKLSTAKLVGKTILKGVASFFNVDLSISEADLQNLYESIDLSGKLIILEDLERTSIDILEVLGYVNSLVEQDGVKVMIVSNEKEIIKYEEKEIVDDSKENSKKIIRVLTKNSKKYLREKEKTISDTIYFFGDIPQAIKNIMLSFNNSMLTGLLKHTDNFDRPAIATEIYREIMGNKNINSENLRAFIYACQKTINIFKSVNNVLDFDFAKLIFMSIVAFALRKKKNDNIVWSSGDLKYDESLGTNKYPLARYCYYNICSQYSYPNELREIEQEYVHQRNIDEQLRQNHKELNIIYNYEVEKEVDVLNAVRYVKEHLSDREIIEPSQYGKLSNYLIEIKHVVGCVKDVDDCKDLMIQNLINCENDITDNILFHSGLQLYGDAKVEFDEFKETMIETLKDKHKDPFDFDYSVEHVVEFCNKTIENRNSYISNHIFARKFDIDKLIELLSRCTSGQILEIRRMFLSIYSFSNIKEYFIEDKDTLVDLREHVLWLIGDVNNFDKIQIMQLKFLASNLQGIIDKLQ